MAPEKFPAQKAARHRLRRLWHLPLLAALLLGAHVALLLHQFEHHSHFDLSTVTDDCAVCSFASSMGAPPETAEFAPPALVPEPVFVLVFYDSGRDLCSCANFSARAPPKYLSV